MPPRRQPFPEGGRLAPPHRRPCTMKLHRERLRRKRDVWFFLMAGPALLGFLVFLVLGPMLYSFYLSFTSYNVVDAAALGGCGELPVPDQGRSGLLAVGQGHADLRRRADSAVADAIALGIALLLNNRVKALGAFRTIYYLPSLLPATASVVIWIWIFPSELRAAERTAGAIWGGRTGLAELDDVGAARADHHDIVVVRRRDDRVPRRTAGRAARLVRGGGNRRGQCLAAVSATSPCRSFRR
jgi:hypothetical protein